MYRKFLSRVALALGIVLGGHAASAPGQYLPVFVPLPPPPPPMQQPLPVFPPIRIQPIQTLPNPPVVQPRPAQAPVRPAQRRY